MAGNIIVSLLTGFDDKGIRNAEKALQSLGDRLKGFGRAAAASAVSYTIGKNAVDFVKQSSAAAMDFQKAMNGVNSVYGDYKGLVSKFIQSSEKIGMSHAEAARNVTFLGSVFKKTGIPMQDVIDKTQTLVSLSADLASTYGGTVDEAMTGISAMFRGEYDPIEKFGVAMKQNQVNAELAARGQNHLTGAAQIAAATLARYDLLMQNTTDAQGAFARQSGSLFEQQQILSAEWTDMQQTLGNMLIPALTALAEAIKPILDKLAPRLKGIFESIRDTLVALTPILPKLGDILVSVFTNFAAILKVAAPLLTGILDMTTTHLGGIIAFVAALKIAPPILKNWSKIKDEITLAWYALGYLWENLKKVKTAQEAFNLVAIKNPYILFATVIIGTVAALADMIPKMVANVQAQDNLKKKTIELNEKLKAQGEHYLDLSKISSNYAAVGRYAGLGEARAWEKANAQLQAYESALNQGHSRSAQERFGMSYDKYLNSKKPGGGGSNVAAAVKTWFQTLQEEMRKQADRIKLQKLGASAGLIDSLLGASDWEAAANRIIAGGKKALAKVQAEFNKTSAGVAEATAAADKAAQDLADRQQKYVEALQTRIDTVKSLTGNLADFVPQTLAEIETQMGSFESSVVSAADTLRNNLASALDNKNITTKAYNSLVAYANAEIAKMQDLAKRRDAIAARIAAAKSVYQEVALAVKNYGNVTSASAAQVTESYTKIIDGVEVTVSRTVDALQSGDLVESYQKIVDRTKAFLEDLVKLKKMGLNQTLFKQIVDAGVDAGKATADAIVNGGQDTVSSLNDLFGQLNEAGSQMADLTAQYMDDSGVKIVSSFIDGLTSQEKSLSDQAADLAKKFSDSFNAAVDLAVPAVDFKDFGLTLAQAIAAAIKAGLTAANVAGGGGGGTKSLVDIMGVDAIKAQVQDQFMTDMLAATGGDRSEALAFARTGAGQQIVNNVTVNAGMGTDPNTLGTTIVNLLKQYERNNGSVWVGA